MSLNNDFLLFLFLKLYFMCCRSITNTVISLVAHTEAAIQRCSVKNYFIKKEALAHVFSCEFCQISKNTFFTEHLWTTASTHKLL